MRIITLHCDYIRFKPLKKALKSVEDLKDKEKDQNEVLKKFYNITKEHICIRKEISENNRKYILKVLSNLKEQSKDEKDLAYYEKEIKRFEKKVSLNFNKLKVDKNFSNEKYSGESFNNFYGINKFDRKLQVQEKIF